MPDGTSMFLVTLFVALNGASPMAGDGCVIAAEECHAVGTLVGLVRERCDNSGQETAGSMEHWSELAWIRVEIGVEAGAAAIGWLMPSGRARSVELWSKEGWAARPPLGDAALPNEMDGAGPIAAGLTVAVTPKNEVQREEKYTAARGLTVWMTGLSGAGKTTIAHELERTIGSYSKVEVLDADVVRTHLCRGLGFSPEDRRENVRRLAVIARLLAETGAVVLVSAISPYRAMRDEARQAIGRFIEVFVNAPLSVCEGRDVKGLYKRARRGEIQSFTGIDDPYEPPVDAEIECRTDLETVEESVAKIVRAIAREGDLPPADAPEPAMKGAAGHGA